MYKSFASSTFWLWVLGYRLSVGVSISAVLIYHNNLKPLKFANWELEQCKKTDIMNKKETWKFIINFIASILTAAAAALGTTSCINLI